MKVETRRGTIIAQLLLAALVGSLCSPGFGQSLKDEESRDYYKKWLKEDVIYIISEEERDVFLKLRTDAERDHFIERFWKRRDPSPETLDNEFKTEHYRRIQYANEHFTAGMSGWKTDRGRIYIKFGPPDDIDDHPAFSTYLRPRHEGGGGTLVNAFQVWYYRSIEGVGSDIEMEFVDPLNAGLYRLTRNPEAKDALLLHPAGFTEDELYNGGNKTERIVTQDFGDLDEKYKNQILRSPRHKDMPFEKLELERRLDAPPLIQYNDLKQLVTAEVSFFDLHFQFDSGRLRVSSNESLVPIWIWVEDSQLTFEEPVSKARRATLEIYGRVSTLDHRVVREFEDTVVRDVPAERLLAGTSMAGKKLLLPSGRYKLDLVVRDGGSKKIGTKKIGTGSYGIVVPPASNKLEVSTVFLADRIEKVPNQDLGDPLVFSGGFKIIPNLKRSFRREQDIQVYFELYNFTLDQSTLKPSLNLETEILKDGKKWPGSEATLDKSQHYYEVLSDRVLIMNRIWTSEMDAGRYQFQVKIRDQISGEEKAASVDFEVSG